MSSGNKRRRSQPAQGRQVDHGKGSSSNSNTKATGEATPESSRGDQESRLVQKDYLLSKDQSIEGATIESAVALLSSSVIPATAGFLYEFLMTYRSFTTPSGLFALLKARLNPSTGVVGSDLALIRLRVVNIFKNWINHCPQDWEATELPALFEGVIASAKEDALLLKHLEPLRQLISKHRDAPSSSAPRIPVPKIALPLYRVQSQLNTIKETAPEILAEQFTIVDIENFEEIAPWDLIRWSRLPESERETQCPSLYRLVDRYYEVGHFVATTIVSEVEMSDRVAAIIKFLDMTKAANELGNFNLMMALYSGITHPVLKRLTTTWDNVPPERLKQLNSFIKYCDPEDNYDAMRTYIELTSTVRPCLPFLGGYLAEMSHIHSLSSDYLPTVSSTGERLINYAKHRKLYQIMSSIKRCNHKIAARRREAILTTIRRLHALPTDGLKIKMADLQEGSSFDILESEDSSHSHSTGFEAVATPRYPVNLLSPQDQQDTSDSSDEFDEEYKGGGHGTDAPTSKGKIHKASGTSSSSKNKSKNEIAKSHSAGAFRVSKLSTEDGGGTASSSGGDSNPHAVQSVAAQGGATAAHIAHAAHVRSKTSSDGALNRKLLVRTTSPQGEILNHARPFLPQRKTVQRQPSNNASSRAGSARSGHSSIISFLDSDEDASDGPSPIAISAAPGTSYGSHSHLFQSGGGHISTGTSPKEMPFQTISGRKDISPLRLAYLDPSQAIAESEDSPHSPNSGSPPRQVLVRQNSRNPSPLRRNTSSPYHSNPPSARSLGKGSSNIIVPADPWVAMSARSGLLTSNLPHSPPSAGSNVNPLTKSTSSNDFRLDNKRYDIACELLETEEQFVHYLKILVEDCVVPLRQKIAKAATILGSSSSTPRTPQSPHQVDADTPLNEAHLRIIFSNIEALYSFHSLFLEDLHNVVRYWRSGGLGALFSQYHHGFEAYVEFTNARLTGDELLQHILSIPSATCPSDDLNTPSLNLTACRLLQRQQEVVLSKTKKANLSALLNLPVHRLPRVLILLKDFKAYTHEGQPEYATISDAISKLEHIAMKLPMSQETAEQSMLQMQMLKRIAGWTQEKRKLRPGRNFDGDFEVKMLIPGTNKFPKITILLWSDVLFFCRTKESRTTKKKKWSIIGVMALTHARLTLLTTKEARSKFRSLSKVNNSGPSTKSTISWAKHPSVVEVSYLGVHWLLSFSTIEIGEVFLREVAENRFRMVGMFLTQFKPMQEGEHSPRISMTSLTTAPGASESATLATIGTKVYMFGGSFRGQWKNEMWLWDTIERNWTKLQSSGDPPLARTEHAMCSIGKFIYVYGGQRFGSYIDDMYSFDTETNVWTHLEFKIPRVEASELASTHSITGLTSPSLTSQLLESESTKSRSGSGSGSFAHHIGLDIPPPRSGHSLNAIGNKLYLFGGQWCETLHQRHLFSDLFVFDPETGYWTELHPTNGAASLRSNTANCSISPPPRQKHVAQVIDNKLVIFGGSGLSSDLSDTWIYDPQLNTWTLCKDVYGYIPTDRALSGSTVFGKKLIIFGGTSDSLGSTDPSSISAVGVKSSVTFNDLFVFDVEAMKWSHCWVPVELDPRRGHSIVATSDNTLTIFCGRVVDPSTGDSEPTSDVLLLHGLSSIINNSLGRAGKLENLRDKCEKLSHFATHHQALLTVVGSHYVTPPSAEGVKWDPLSTKSTFSLLENLGSLVYKAMHEPTQSLVAIKVLSHHDCSLEMLDIMAEEMQLLSRCRHPGLTAYHGFAPVSSELWIVSELSTGNSLDQIQGDFRDTLSEKQVGAILVTILEALAYLHSQDIVHKNIKASNVLLNTDGRVKLTDWGLSSIWKPLTSNAGQQLLTLTAPELAVSGDSVTPPPTDATDIYDIGLMVVGLLEPYGPGRQLRTRHRFSAEALDFVSLCTASFPHRRPTAVQLLSHPFILPQLQNAQRDDSLRALYSEAGARKFARRALDRGSSGGHDSSHHSRKSSGGGSGNGSTVPSGFASRRKIALPEDVARMKASIEELQAEHNIEKERLNREILTLQNQNSSLEARLRSLETLVHRLAGNTE